MGAEPIRLQIIPVHPAIGPASATRGLWESVKKRWTRRGPVDIKGFLFFIHATAKDDPSCMMHDRAEFRGDLVIICVPRNNELLRPSLRETKQGDEPRGVRSEHPPDDRRIDNPL
jgi:hypothetical protein